MPYEVAFTKPVQITDREQYINDCCIGGDLVVDRLLPAVKAGYSDIETNQEDWGWFIWFRKGDVRLAIDVHTDDGDAGQFRIHLTSRVKKFVFGDKVVDMPELEELRVLIESELRAWGATDIKVERLDGRYM